MWNFIDITGKKFGRLLVIKRTNDHITPKGHHITMWECKCDCGNTKTITGHALKQGFTKSCGCISKKHGKTKTRLFNIWVNMRQRCYNSKIPEFHLWGGKGVAVCDEWRNDFKTFYDWAMSNGYTDELTIDRIDNNGNYEPSNCRWVTAKAQAMNLSSNHKITINGKTKTLCEWLEVAPITASTYHKRKKKGMNDKDALFTQPYHNRGGYGK